MIDASESSASDDQSSISDELEDVMRRKNHRDFASLLQRGGLIRLDFDSNPDLKHILESLGRNVGRNRDYVRKVSIFLKIYGRNVS